MIKSYWIQLFISVVFLLVIYLISRYLSKKGSKISLKSKNIKVIEKYHLGQKEKVVLMSVNNENLLVGVTANQITLLKKMDDFKPNEQK